MRNFFKAEEGTAIAEFALIFPILFTLTLGIWEVGSAIHINQKSIASAQILADLIARKMSVDDDSLEEAIRAAQLAIEPYSLEPYGIDILSVTYNEDDEPEEVWRETRDMTADPDLIDRTIGLGTEYEGAVVVRVTYEYEPALGGMVLRDDVLISEVAFARGRRNAVVERVE